MLQSMDPERFYQIDQMLGSRRFVTRAELMKRLGVSWATLKRDLAYLKDRLHAPIVFDHESAKPDKIDPAVAAFFKGLKPKKGDTLIAFGWAKAEDLDKLMPPA